ncbi:hypothetical protein ACEPAF_1523 [Sanghuangporus sanghuang]
MTVKLVDLHSLPIFPSSTTLRSLPPSQQSAVLEHISSTLFYALSLQDERLSKLLCNDFIASYARQEATRMLGELIFFSGDQGTERRPPQERFIRKRVLSLALRLSNFPRAGGLTLPSILDLCVAYGARNSSRVKEIMEKAVRSHPTLLQEIRNNAVPSFASIILSTGSGLHALRKTAFCLKHLLQCSPPSVLDEFLKDNDFVVALAKCYNGRLSAIATGYGGVDLDREDDTETTTSWVGCKVDLLDCFHVLLQHTLNNVRIDPRANAERAFSLVFALLNLPTSSGQSHGSEIPFLNRSLVADYQDAYGLSSTLASVLSYNDDPRLDVLDATLKSFETVGSGDKCGALRIILRSTGAPSGIDYRGVVGPKGKERAPPPPEPPENVDLDAAVSSVLNILPDQEPAYIRALLALPRFDGNAEQVIAALLEGEAPPPSSVKSDSFPEPSVTPVPQDHAPPVERRNIFDEQQLMETTNVQVGKRRGDADTVLQDRGFLDQMKADILRRAAELTDSDEDGQDDDELDDLESVLDSGVKVVADREDIEGESDEDEDEDTEGEAPLQTPEMICELAYLKDPKLFNRDVETRRSKARADLKAQTGWTDEQLEGWRVMLERNPKKDKILLKHEFKGNKKGPILIQASDQPGSSSDRGRGRGRGRGGNGRGRGGGGPRRGGAAGSNGGDARERARKDKNKARQANHNRKRGHDRKMARGGGIPGPST